MISLKNNSLGYWLLAFTLAVSTNSLPATGGRRTYFELLNNPITRELSWFDLSGSLLKTPFSSSCLACECSCIPRVFDENNQQQLYNIRALEAAFPVGDYKGLTTKLGRKKPGNEISTESCEKLLYISGILEGHTHIQELYECPGKTWEDSNLSYLTCTEAITSRKWRLRQSCKPPMKY